MNDLIIYTMCRSGNHAIIFWILENLGGTDKSIENCCYWNDKTKVYFYNNCNHVSYHYVNSYKYMIKSYEDVNANGSNKIIIILRDFVNLIASRYKKYGEKLGLNWSYPQDLNKIKGIWKQHANLILSDKNVTGILYNKWITDKEYRDNISVELKINNIKDKTDYVSTIGEGSSFSGIKLESSKNNYTERYRQIEFPKYIIENITNDNELCELNKQLFDMNIRELFVRDQ